MGLTPYYQDDHVIIYHGDCRDILPGLSGDVVLTDPPYGIGLGYDQYEDTADNLAALVADVMPLMLAAAPVVALTPGVANVWRYPQPRWMLCWNQASAGSSATGNWGFNQWQPVLVYGTDPYLKRGMGRRPDVVSVGAFVPADHRKNHPCPKPIEAWRKILVRVSPCEGETVVDPFMGSGSTLDAAKYTGRKAIGIELSERYCEIAANRMGQEVLDFGAVG